MRAFALLAVFALLLSCTFADFTFYKMVDGTGEDYEDEYNEFDRPISIFVKNGTLFVSDTGNDRVYEMDGNEIGKKIGPSSGVNKLTGQRSIWIDEEGRIFIANKGESRVQIYEGSNINMEGYSGSSGEFLNPYAFVPYDDVYYVLDGSNDRIYYYDTSFRYQGYAGEPGNFNLQFSRPSDMWAANGKIYVADTYNDRIQVLTTDFEYVDSFGTGRGGLKLSQPEGIYVGSDRVYVADTANHRIVVFSMSGYPIETFGSQGDGNDEFESPTDVFVEGDKMYVADSYNGRVMEYIISNPPSPAGPEVEGLDEKLEDLNDSIEDFEELYEEAEKIGVNATQSADYYYGLALSSYQLGDFTQSETYAVEGLVEAENDMRDLERAIRRKVLARIGDASRDLLSLENRAEAMGIQLNTTLWQSFLDDADEQIEDEDYEDAVSSVLSAEEEFASLRASLESSREDVESEIADVSSEIGDAEARLETIEYNAEEYNVEISILKADTFIEKAHNELEAYEFESAREALDDADAEMDKLESSVSAKQQEVAGALAEIQASEQAVLEIKNSGFLLTPDVSQAEQMIAEAEELAYSSPANATAKAQAAVESAEAARSAVWGMIGGSIVIILVVMLVGIAAVVFVGKMLLDRRKKGL